MPRYKFRWSNLPVELLAELCEDLFVDCAGYDPAEVLCDAYGARPKENFVAGMGHAREGWLPHDKESRHRVVSAMRTARREDGQLRTRRDQMEYLRRLRSAETLRSVVLQTFIDCGGVEPEPRETIMAPPARVKPKPATTSTKTSAPPSGEDVTTAGPDLNEIVEALN